MDGGIADSAVVNYNLENKFEVENFCFTLPPDIRNKKIAGGLSLFVLSEKIGNSILEVLFNLAEFMIEDKKKRDIDYWYGNSIKKT